MNLIYNELDTDDSNSYSSSISALSNVTSNNTSETNSLEEEQQNANTDTIQVAETSEHENNNNLKRSGTRLRVSDNINNLDRTGNGHHPDTNVTLSRSNNVMGVSNNWAESSFYNGPSPAKKDVTKLKKIGNFIKITFKIK